MEQEQSSLGIELGAGSLSGARDTGPKKQQAEKQEENRTCRSIPDSTRICVIVK